MTKTIKTATEENYLKAIFKLSQTDLKKVSLTAIAEQMEINSASVIDMVKKLALKGWLNYDKKNGAELTTVGQASALQIIRKHRLWEVFLYEKLRYGWDEVHSMAEQLEHIQHEDLADRLEEFLGHPEYDPHGDPIPQSNGKIPVLQGVLLKDAHIGDVCEVVAVRDTSSLFLQYLGKLSLGIGSKIKVQDKIEFDGSMIIIINSQSAVTISQKLSENLIVQIEEKL